MALTKIEHKAAKKQFLTLDEVAAFVQAARRSGASGSEVVIAGVSIGGRLQRLTIEVEVQPIVDAVQLDKP
jgi:hypothetical protein